MALSIYVHIPYCLQRCRYCDFTTFEWQQIRPPEEYVQLVLEEIRYRHHDIRDRQVETVYFGGGTPSLLSAELIVSILQELANVGFVFSENCERTIEINPATITPQKVQVYVDSGINRFSVGAQSFNDRLLATCGRRHSAQETRETLNLLRGFNYSFDLLFALPGQTVSDLLADLEEVRHYDPPHLSAYCLTVPEGHPMSQGRPPEGEQVEMFEHIERALAEIGTPRYEISNFAKEGMESRHNMAYWSDREFWGLGLSAHSYLRQGPFGVRFWNPKDMEEYEAQVRSQNSLFESLPNKQQEWLEEYEALTDFCHTRLRLDAGLSLTALRNKFSSETCELVQKRLQKLVQRDLATWTGDSLSLTAPGRLLSNLAFQEISFVREELAHRSLPKTLSLA